jgi:hypothetical protein
MNEIIKRDKQQQQAHEVCEPPQKKIKPFSQSYRKWLDKYTRYRLRQQQSNDSLPVLVL